MTIATPVPARTSGLPATDPAACTIAPRAEFPLGQEGDLTALSPTPTPSIDETGAIPADDGAIAAVAATAAMAIACQNAGDLPRMLAAFSDSWLMGRFDSYDLVFVDRFYDEAALPATPVPPDEQRTLIAVTDVMALPDGAIVATIVTTAGGVEEQSRLRFVLERDVLVIDEAVVLYTGA